MLTKVKLYRVIPYDRHGERIQSMRVAGSSWESAKDIAIEWLYQKHPNRVIDEKKTKVESIGEVIADI